MEETTYPGETRQPAAALYQRTAAQVVGVLAATLASSTRFCQLCSTWHSSMHCGVSLTGQWLWHAVQQTRGSEVEGFCLSVSLMFNTTLAGW